MRTHLRARRLLGVALLLAAGLVGTPAEASPPAGGMTATAVTSMVGAYGDNSGRWAGGDTTVSTLLPDGRVAWFFSDTFVGTVNADHSLGSGAVMVHNSIVLQDGASMTATLTGGTAQAPASLVDTGVADEWYWANNAVVNGSALQVLYGRYRRSGPGSLDFQFLGTALAQFALPALTLTSVATLPTGSSVSWGADLVTSGAYTYVFGTEGGDGTGLKFAHLARVPVGGLGGAWSYWTGTAWSTDPAASAGLLSGVGTGYGVQVVAGTWVLVTVDTNLPFDSSVVAYTASAPTGPWTGPVPLFTAPELAAGDGRPIIAYDAHLHPELATAGKLLVSYNVNSLNVADVSADIRNFRPRFVDVTWPRPVPNPANLPAAPTGLTATADASGTVHLTWSAPAGLTFTVFQRDVTAGQTHFARQPVAATVNGADVGLLSTGHTYEFKVAGVNASGEGPASTTVSAAVTIAAPPAPTGLAAAPQSDGTIRLTWSAVAGAWSYDLLQRDVTAGETVLVSTGATIGSATTYTTPPLTHQHAYQFAVTARHGGGVSPASTTVSATAAYAVPGAPTGLTATPNTDGTVALAWTAPAPNLWYNVYQRDTTAGETTFTLLPLPITATAMTAGFLTAGHDYTWKIAAVTAGGEGPASATATARPAYPLPAAPNALTATPTDGGAVLTWTASPTAGAWYNAYQRDATAGETSFTLLPYPLSTCCTFTAGLMTNGHTYEFKLTAIGPGGESAATNVVSVTPQPVPPAAPTGLTATATANGGVTLAWTSPDPSLFTVVYARDVTAGEAFMKLPVPDTTCCTADLGGGLNIEGHVYEYKVASLNGAGVEGATSNTASATAHYTPPPAPGNVRATVTGSGSVTLDWDAVPDAIYWIYVRDVTQGQGAFTRLQYPVAATTFSYGPTTNGDSYEFKVSAVTGGGEGPVSAAVAVTAVGGLPQAPTAPQAVALDAGVRLTWTASPTAGAWYVIYQRDVTANQSWQQLPVPLTTCCTFTGGYLTNGHTYEFKVAALNGAGQSLPTPAVSVRPMPPIPAPATGLTLTPGNGKVSLHWTVSPTPGVSYWVEQRANGGAWRRLPLPAVCCAMDAGYLTNFTSYSFRVVAYNIAGESAPSNAPSATPVPPVPAAPTNLRVTGGGSGHVDLAWNASSTPGVWYVIEMQAAGGAWQRLKYPVSTCCVFTVSLLTDGVTYSFRIRATNGYDSAASATISYRPMPPAPGAPACWAAAQSAGPGQVLLSWCPSPTPNVVYWIYYRLAGSDQAGLRIPRGQQPLNTWQRSRYPVTLTTFTMCCGFQPGELYEFQITAANLTGESARTQIRAAIVSQLSNPSPWRAANQSNGADDRAAGFAAGKDCEHFYYQVVCYSTSVPLVGQGDPTIGDYFFTRSSRAQFHNQLTCEAYKRANLRYDWNNVTVDIQPYILLHEATHSNQWANYRYYEFFVRDYLKGVLASEALYQNYWSLNWFEIYANLIWGNYAPSLSTGRTFSAAGIDCDGYY